MARADSTILVKILGDSKGLQGELRASDRGIKGFAVSAKGIATGIAAGIVTDKILDFAQTALGEADRLGDAQQRLELQLGRMADPLKDTADKYADIGASAQDILELEAAFTDTATALGVGKPDIADWADDAAAIASAMSLMSDVDAATIVDQIGKAAGGSERALRALGINLSDAEVAARAMRDTGKPVPELLTDSEKAAAAYQIVLEKLAPRLDAVAGGNTDLEQSQREVQAKFETLTGKIGDAIDGPLNDLLTWILNGIEGWELLGSKVAEFQADIEEMTGPLKDAIGLLSDFVGLLGDALTLNTSGLINRGSGFARGLGSSSRGGPGRGGSLSPHVTVNVSGGDPAEVERSVRRAIRDYNDRNGALITG